MLFVRGKSLLGDEAEDAPLVIDGQVWELQQLLGEGTSSQVYAASCSADGLPVRAIKVTPTRLLDSRERAALDKERLHADRLRAVGWGFAAPIWEPHGFASPGVTQSGRA